MKTPLIAIAALSLACPAAALADPPPWAGGGHGHGNPHGEPPGLAKKPYGMPPGQAKKLWRQGERLPPVYLEQRTYVIVEPRRYHLRPAPYGYRWVRIDDRYYLAQTRSGLIAQVVEALVR
ncbi:MAG TPA: RcnB family protein [Phenylobacterium sp.]|uniref:RcnB family protein n=1 Tax=Phenylobacterium sp. TaxID=1871053 RepID=UPI002B60F60C|nr:RcnB family protein [Phenylobacterium sp.]HSV03886.1 RcnB family protein [Phenylobacterium sp.]